MYSKNREENYGFTLIELMIVIAIIGVLASLVLTSLSRGRRSAVVANTSVTIRSLSTALELYYQDHGDWPAGTSAGANGRMMVYNYAGGGWDLLLADLQPYLSGTPLYNLPYTLSGGFVIQGYRYVKGTESSPLHSRMYNGSTGAYMGCVKIYNGYWISAFIKDIPQSTHTLKDGGMDPDGVDNAGGHYLLDTSVPVGSCPEAAIIK